MGTILNLSKLAQVKMKFTSAILIGISASLARADWGPGGGFGGYGNGGDWGNNWGWGGHLTVLKHASPQSFRLNPPPGLALVHLKRSLTIALPQPVQQQQLSMRALPV